jgi:hypothetical protein
MFGLHDIIKFLWSFFLILPLVIMVHILGHITFAAIFGAKGIRVRLGSGKRLFSFWKIAIHQFYFWSGDCEFEYVTFDNRLTKTIILLGGSTFNLLSMLLLNLLIWFGVFEPSLMAYQFIYFSFYYMFFALLPMDYPGGGHSDGKALYHLWKKGERSVS